MKPGLSFHARSGSGHALEQAVPFKGCSLDAPIPQATQAARRMFHAVRGRPGPDDRPPLPAGHPQTWGCINEGTCIAGAPYPFPVFLS